MIGVAICLIVILYYQTDTIEEMLNYIEYNPNNYNSSFTVPSPAVLEFQKENCDGNVLKYKNMEVKSTLAEHVFPNIHFGNGEPCNPCSPSCTFSIIESKLKTEEEMIPESTVL